MFSTALAADLSDRPGPPPSRDRRGRSLAVGVSVAVHLVVGLVVLGTAGGAAITGGGGTPEDSAITVSLAGVEGSRQASASYEQKLRELYRRARDSQSDLTASDKPPQQTSSLAKLFDDIEREHDGREKQQGTQGKTTTGQADGAGSKAVKPTPVPTRANDHAAAGEGAADSSGGLWGQIEPCWKHMPNRSTVPVTVEIELDAAGRIAKPPTLIRPDGGAPSEARLIAEARALAAIAACAPYQRRLNHHSLETITFHNQ